MHRFAQKTTTTTTNHPKSLKILVLCEGGFPEEPIGICNGHLSSAMALFFMPSKNSKVSWQQLPSTFLNKAEQLAA
jgi:hypothetical protein